jgi:23S rRNA (cytidine1920-2'-O)/16S rRNA (cytidine1409-2'-O)-methyltransferase
MKTRLDQILVERGLADSREKARALILAGSVLVEGQKSDKPGHAFPEHCRIEVAERLPYVSRGGFKLAAALDHFGIDVRGRVCLDVGASTGGFTDCLLQRGAARVYATDVGHGQLDWKLRNDPRVIVQEGVNARYLQPADFPESFHIAVCDASFISTTLLIPAFAPLLSEQGEMIILVKPQFEVGKDQVGKGGIVRDPELHKAACARVQAAVEALGFTGLLIESPILGAEGNREFLLYARH